MDERLQELDQEHDARPQLKPKEYEKVELLTHPRLIKLRGKLFVELDHVRVCFEIPAYRDQE